MNNNFSHFHRPPGRGPYNLSGPGTTDIGNSGLKGADRIPEELHNFGRNRPPKQPEEWPTFDQVDALAFEAVGGYASGGLGLRLLGEEGDLTGDTDA